MLACRHFLTHGPTGWELHNRSAKLLILILNCFGSFIVCKCGRVVFCGAWLSGGITVMVSYEWFYILSSLPCNGSLFLLFTMPPSWSLFAGNILSLPPCASLDLHGTQFFSIKNVLFLVHCVKTWLSHPVYVWVHWNNFPSPEGLSGLFSFMRWSPVYCVSHCMQNHYATPCISRRATGPEWQPATNHSPSHLTFPLFFAFTLTPFS